MLESIYHTGIITFSSSNDIIIDNRISDSGFGLRSNALNNSMISRNVISNSILGILLADSFENLIDGNTVKNSSGEGLVLSASSYNSLLHNNFMNNTHQSSLYNSVNEWDNGCEGSYWCDYNGTDLDNDGIGDTPYVIDVNNQDNYPLMEPWTPTPPIPTTIDELEIEIEELGFEGEIDNRGIVKGLSAKLNVAQKLIDDGKINQATTILESFIRQVQNLTDIHITPEAADILIESAEYIISHL